MQYALAIMCCLLPATSWACEVIESSLHRVNPNAVVEQPEPPPIEALSAKATISPTIAGGCSDEGCPDRSALTFTITLPEDAERRFGYDIELIDAPANAPFILGGLAPLEGTDDIEVVVRWGSTAQNRSGPFQARLRTINLKGEFGPWSAPVNVVPASGSSGTQGSGPALVLVGGLLLWGRRRQRV